MGPVAKTPIEPSQGPLAPPTQTGDTGLDPRAELLASQGFSFPMGGEDGTDAIFAFLFLFYGPVIKSGFLEQHVMGN